MLEALLALFSSSGIGSIIGLVGGLFNRKIDLAAKQADYKFQLDKMEAERAYLKDEIAGRTQIATIEADGLVEAAGYEAMAKSYSFAVPTQSDGVIDKISKLVRPLLTVAFFLFTVLVYVQIQQQVSLMKIEVYETKELIELYKYLILWVLFQAGVAIGWWFAMRPGKMATFGGKQ